MTPRMSQTVTQIQNTIAKSYNLVKDTLQKDTSAGGIAVNAAIARYQAYGSNATPANLVILEQALYTYQNQLVNRDGLHIAAEVLLLNIKSIITDNQIGHTLLDSNLAKEYVNGKPSSDAVLVKIKAAVAALTGDFTKNDIVNAIAAAINASGDSALINALKLDMNSSVIPASVIQANIANISGTDGPSIGVSIYQCFQYLFISADASSIQGATSLSSAIDAYHDNSSVPYATILSNIQNAISALPSGATNADIANAMAAAVGASGNSALITALELDLGLVSNLAGSSRDWLQSRIVYISGTDGPSIAGSYYSVFYDINISSFAGAISLNAHINDELNNHSIAYVTTANNIMNGVAGLTGNFTDNDIVNQIVTNVGASGDADLINALKIGLDLSNQTTPLLQNSIIGYLNIITGVKGTDGPSISDSLYNILSWSPQSSIKGMVALSNDITNYHNNGSGPSYTAILTAMKTGVAALTGGALTINGIAVALATAVGAGDDANLIAYLELDLDESGQTASILQAGIANISGTDGPSISLNFYQNTMGFSISKLPGAVAFDDDLVAYYNNGSGPSYATILTAMKAGVAALTGGALTYNGIAVALATAIGAGSDAALINYLEVDFIDSNVSTAQIQINIANLSGTDAPSITASLYNGFVGVLDSSIQGLIALNTDIIAAYANGSGIPYATILANIKSEVAALTGSFTKNDIALAIARGVGASSDATLINLLMLDLDSGSISAATTQTNIANISGTDGPSIADSIYNCFNSISNIAGAADLSAYITSIYGNGDGVAYADTLFNIKFAVTNLTGDNISYNGIAVAVAYSVGAGSDNNFINELELDLINSGRSPGDIRDNIAGIVDASDITAAIYSAFWYFSSSVPGITSLNSYIETMYNNGSGTPYATIITNMQSSVAALTGSFTKNDIAAAIATSVGARSDTNFINYLKLDLDASPDTASVIQTNFANIAGTDGPSITTSIYQSFINYLGMGLGSASAGLIALSIDIANDPGDNYINTLTSGMGNIPIGPKADVYLNKCTATGDVYTVGGSVFNGFDIDANGPALTSMTGLNSLTGHAAALAQCGTLARSITKLKTDVYVTTIAPGGTVGNSTVTGCELLPTAGDVLGECQSVFDMSNIPV